MLEFFCFVNLADTLFCRLGLILFDFCESTVEHTFGYRKEKAEYLIRWLPKMVDHSTCYLSVCRLFTLTDFGLLGM